MPAKKKEQKKDEDKPIEKESSETKKETDAKDKKEDVKKDEDTKLAEKQDTRSSENKAESDKSDETKEPEEPGEQGESKKSEVPEESKDKEPEEPEQKELTQEDIITILKRFPGVGQVMAERIYDAGFSDREKLSSISVEDAKKIKGIGHSLAETISTGIEESIKKFDHPEDKAEDKKEPTGDGITDKALGFIKGTFTKITGFFKGKKPKGPADAGKPEEVDKNDVEVSETDKADSEDGFPEVGRGEQEKDVVSKHEQVSVEASDAEDEPGSKDVLLDQAKEGEGPEIKTEEHPKEEEKTEPEVEEKVKVVEKIVYKEKEPEPEKISLKDPSALLKWFEVTGTLNSDTGKIIFKAGYNNLEELKEAVVDDLILIKGIERKEAEIICSELKKLD